MAVVRVPALAIRWRRHCAANLRAAALAVVGPVPVDHVDVHWRAPPQCPDGEAVRRAVFERLEPRERITAIRASVTVQRHGPTFVVAVELWDDDGVLGRRTLQAATCAQAVTAAAVVIAIAANSDTEVRTTPLVGPKAETPLSPATSATLPADRSALVPRDPRPNPTRGLQLSVGVRGGLEAGILGPIAGAVGGKLELLGSHWHFSAGVHHRTRNDVAAKNLDNVGGRYWVTAARAAAGPRWTWGRLELPVHAGVGVGIIRARGMGEVDPVTSRRLWVAGLLGLRAVWAPRKLVGLELGAEGVVPVLRPTFTLSDGRKVLTVGAAGLRAWLGVAVRFSL